MSVSATSIVLKFLQHLLAFNGFMEWLLIRVEIELTLVLQGNPHSDNCVVSYSETNPHAHYV